MYILCVKGLCRLDLLSFLHAFGCTVELGDKELFGQPKDWSLIANVPYPYEVN